MNAILGFTDILYDEETDEKKKEYLKLIKQSGNNLLNLLNDIIDFSKIESGKIVIEKREFNIKQLLSHIYNMFKFKADEKGVNLKLIIEDEVPNFIILDELRLNQIIINLVSNAIKFTEKGEIVIKCEVEKNDIIISVSDTGIGIAQDKISKIFKPFEQGDSSISRKYGGTGLGLTITKKLTELMNGKIFVESEENKGSKFTIRFPLEKVEKKKEIEYKHIIEEYKEILNLSGQEIIKKWENNPKIKNNEIRNIFFNYIKNLQKDILPLENAIKINNEKDIKFLVNNLLITAENLGITEIIKILKEIINEIRKKEYDIAIISEFFLILKKLADRISDSLKTKEIEEVKQRKLKILVVEDNLTNQKLIGIYLKKLGEEADFAENGKQALEKLSEKKYDLIFLDIQMPIMDGTQAIKEIKSNEKYKDIYVIALTAHALKGDAEKYLSLGFDDYMSKPLDLNKIKEKLDKVFLLITNKEKELKELKNEETKIELTEKQKENLKYIISNLERNIKIFSPNKIKLLTEEILNINPELNYFKSIKKELEEIAENLNTQKLKNLIKEMKEKLLDEKE